MNLRQKAADFSINLLKNASRLLGKDKATKLLAQMSEELAPISAIKTKYGDIKFFCAGSLPVWRAKTLLTKEPETISWIDSFDQKDTLWDIGANIGIYSLYAAKKGVNVLSFEPGPGNYYLLSKNIEINNMDDYIQAYCLALNDTTKLDSIYFARTKLGGSLVFGEARNWQNEVFKAQLKLAMLGFSIDDFIEKFNAPFPNHIKIDVDGNEEKIVIGAKKTLCNKKLKSVLIELVTTRTDYYQKIINLFENSGLKLFKKEHAPEFDKGRFSKVYNHIFVRQ